MTVKRKALEVAAQELNFFLDPNPPINIKEKSDVLKQKVIEAGNLLEDGEQELSLSTTTGLEGEELKERKTKIAGIQNTLKELGVKLFGGEPIENIKQEATEAPITENADTQTTLINMVQEAKKLVDLKAIVGAEDEFKPLRESLDDYTGLAGPRLLKAEMLKVLGVEVKKPETKTKEKKEKKEKISRYTRQEAVIDSVRTLCENGANVSDITSAANDIYAKNGGKKLEKLQHMGNVTGHTLKALIAFNVLAQDEGIYQFVSGK